MLCVCPLKKDSNYIYEGTCAVKSCMYFAERAEGGCIARHTSQPTLEELAYYKNLTLKEANALRTTGRASIVRILTLYRYSLFCSTEDVPEQDGSVERSAALAMLEDVRKRKPYSVRSTMIAPNLGTLAAMFQEEHLNAFIQVISVKKKLTLKGLLGCSNAEVEVIQAGLLNFKPNIKGRIHEHPNHSTRRS